MQNVVMGLIEAVLQVGDDGSAFLGTCAVLDGLTFGGLGPGVFLFVVRTCPVAFGGKSGHGGVGGIEPCP